MKRIKREIRSRVSEGGYKITPQRRAIFCLVASSRGHLTAADVYRKVKQNFPKIGLVTVYRSLEMLEGLGLICRIHTEKRSRSYMLAPPKHHHHLVCSSCDRVIDLYDCSLEEIEKRLSQETGFKIQGHLLQFFGLCKNCQKTH